MKNSELSAYPTTQESIEDGLTKREIFVLHAMQALISSANHHNETETWIAMKAIAVADRVLLCLGEPQ